MTQKSQLVSRHMQKTTTYFGPFSTNRTFLLVRGGRDLRRSGQNKLYIFVYAEGSCGRKFELENKFQLRRALCFSFLELTVTQKGRLILLYSRIL